MIPQNPETLVLKNEFYPNGLREIDIWKYYQKERTNILRETLGKTLMIFFAVDLNNIIVVRKNKSKGLIRLSPSNYDEIISGRTISIHSIMDRHSNFVIIDIDTDNFIKAKEVTIELYDLLNSIKIINGLRIKNVSIRFSGKSSFHIKVLFREEYQILILNHLIHSFLISKEINKKYTISHKRLKDIPNIDLNRNVYNAGYITLNSLAVTGLKCMNVDTKKIKNFKKEDTMIFKKGR